MKKEKWILKISPQEAAGLLDEKMDAELIEAYELVAEETDAAVSGSDRETEEADTLIADEPAEKEVYAPCCVVRIYEKWFGLTGAKATLTVTLDNLSGVTRAQITSTGGTRIPRGNLDWGVHSSFEKMAKDILAEERIQP